MQTKTGHNLPSTTFLAALLALVAGLVIGSGVLDNAFQSRAVAEEAVRPVMERGSLTTQELSRIEVFEQLAPSVVYITSTAVRRNRFSLNEYEIPAGSGTGMIWDREGHIVTNFHVAEYGSSLRGHPARRLHLGRPVDRPGSRPGHGGPGNRRPPRGTRPHPPGHLRGPPRRPGCAGDRQTPSASTRR